MDKGSYFTTSHWRNLLFKKALGKFLNKGLFLDASEFAPRPLSEKPQASGLFIKGVNTGTTKSLLSLISAA